MIGFNQATLEQVVNRLKNIRRDITTELKGSSYIYDGKVPLTAASKIGSLSHIPARIRVPFVARIRWHGLRSERYCLFK
jgi:hypothetical protein